MAEKLKVINLGAIPYLNTQTLWHAAAVTRSDEIEKNDLLLINWPRETFVSCGFHQVIETEINVPYCQSHSIPIVRRFCGGGQTLLDGDQIFYQIVTHNKSKYVSANLGTYYKQLLEPVIETYRDFGVSCQFKPVNDIITSAGKKISGNGAGQLADHAKVLVGNFILNFPKKEMSNIIRVPSEKFRDKVYQSLEQGMSTFKEELGYIPDRNTIINKYLENFAETLDVELVEGELESATLEKLLEINEMYKTPEWIYQVSKRSKSHLLERSVKIKSGTEIIERKKKTKGGLVKILMECKDNTINDLLISGDFFIIPADSIKNIEKTLIGKKLDKKIIKNHISQIYQANQVQSPGTSIDEITELIYP